MRRVTFGQVNFSLFLSSSSRNGVGKSTLLRRIQAGKIPGFPPHIATLYIPQELPTPQEGTSAVELVTSHFLSFSKSTSTSLQYQIELLEKELEECDDGNDGNMEALCEELSNLQDAIDEARQDGEPPNKTSLLEQAKDSLTFFDINPALSNAPYTTLSPGQRKKVALAVAVLCASTSSPSQQLLLCFDEPTNHLDVSGLIKLRKLLLHEAQNRTVLLVSHDTDLLNDVATDTIIFSHVQKTLLYFPGNYFDFQRQLGQQQLHLRRQQVSLDKRRQQTVHTIHYLQDQPAPKRGGSKKKGTMIAAQKKKLNRQGIEKNESGHRWTQQKAGTGIKPGALNGIDASTRKDLSPAELLKFAEASVRPPPDKAVQFV
jgi:ATPase subunit of ABC transporter with duplicated ATPase domains